MVNLGRLLALFSVVLYTGMVSAQRPDTTFWVPNGPVNSLLLHDTTVILGGDFNMISPATGSWIRLDTTTAQVDPNQFKVDGAVYATLRADDGSIYVGGRFNRVGNQSVNNLFRIKPDGTFDNSFVHTVLGTVYCLCVHDTDLFIGGEFISIDGEPRSNFGGISLNTGMVNLCDPEVNGPVYCMEVDQSLNYMVIGGNFNEVKGFNPAFLAKISMETGHPFTFNAVPWTAVPNTNGPVYDIHFAGVRLYIAGEFTMFASVAQKGIAALLSYDGTLLPDHAQINGAVYEMEFTDSSIYIGGVFSSVDGLPRMNIACVDSFLDVRPWNPDANGVVRTITVLDKNRLFVGGDFTTFAGDTCIRGAIVYKATAHAMDWDPRMNATVYTSVCDSSLHLYAGGTFFGAGGVLRNNLCAVSTITGKVTAWDPDANAAVHTLALDGDTLYFAGDFTVVSGSNRGRFAALSLSGDSLLPFNPGVNGLVRTIAITGSDVYAGGNFTTLGGQPRSNIGKVSKSTGLATPWNPNCGGTVNTILTTSHWIYVSGFFVTIGGEPRMNVARLHPGTGLADQSWTCDTDDGVFHAEFYNGKLALCGWFDLVNTQLSPDLAFVDTTSLLITPLNFTCNTFVRTFTRYGDDFFLSGPFDLVNAAYVTNLVAYDEGNNNVDPWAPFPDAPALTMQADATRLYTGGTMLSAGGVAHPCFQVFDVQWVTGMDESSMAQEGFSVWPVPATDQITVQASGSGVEYCITDITGKAVQCGTLSAAVVTIPLAELSSGVYFITLTAENGIPVSQKFVKQ